MRRLIDLLSRIWAWGRVPGIKLFRLFAGTVLVAAAIGWFFGSIWVEDLKLCSETEGPAGTRTTCERASLADVAVLGVPGLLLLGWGIEELTIPGVGTVRPPRRRRGGDDDGGPTEPAPPRDRFLERWPELDPWSRLASRLASTTFRGQLASATTSPGTVDRRSLARGDAELIRPLQIGAEFTASGAETWATANRETLNRLRSLADPERVFAYDEYEDGLETIDDLLADLRNRQLLA
jgi:hypothetical protein